MPPDRYIQDVLALIESAELENVEHNLLRLFVEDAVDSSRAAEYIADRIDHRGSDSNEQVLRSIKSGWASLLHRCTCSIASCVSFIAKRQGYSIEPPRS